VASSQGPLPPPGDRRRGAVDQDVEAAQRRECGVRHRLGLICPGEIADRDMGLAAFVADRRRDLRRVVGIAAVDEEPRALARQPVRGSLRRSGS